LELKYIIFFVGLVYTLPLGYLLSLDRRLLRARFFGMMLVPLAFERTAINFFPAELYRGTARGMEISLAYLLCLSALLAMYFGKVRIRFYVRGLWAYILLFLCSVVSVINAESALISFYELWKMLMMYLVLVCVYSYLRHSKDYEVFVWGITCMLLLSFLVVVKGKYLDGIYQARGVFPHQNSMGMYLNLICPVFLAGWMQCKSFFKSSFFAICLLLNAAALVSTYSRGAILCFPIGCAVATVLCLTTGINTRKLRILVCMALCALVGIGLFLSQVVYRFKHASTASGNARVFYATAAWNMIKAEPLGVGVNNWSLKMDRYYPYNPKYLEPERWENRQEEKPWGIVETVYLLVGAECGWLGLLALLCWYAAIFALGWRSLPAYRQHSQFYLLAGICGGLVAVFLHSTLEWVLKQQINFMQMMVVYAIVASMFEHQRSGTLPQSVPAGLKAGKLQAVGSMTGNSRTAS
jgi:hypothetical protein